MIGKKKICGILQETINKADKKFMVVGIGINLIKSPNISNYPTTSIFEITKKKINKEKVFLKLKKMYEHFIPLFCKLTYKKINKI